LSLRPWSLDFTPDEIATLPFPHNLVINPYQFAPPLEWTTDDWDPALRFLTLPFDKHLTEWLKAADPSLPSIWAAREFAGQYEKWQVEDDDLDTVLINRGWLETADLEWRETAATAPAAWNAIRTELVQLTLMMEDDRARYLAEAEAQADGLSDYMTAYIGASPGRHPWTFELVSAGLAIGNVAYLFYKAHFKRVRPSVLCPGLTPPFGPPAHPSYPSGHSFLGHFVALLLLQIPGLSQRFGIMDDPPSAVAGRPPKWADLNGDKAIPSPLLWLSQRLARNREVIGVHYPSDSMASRHLAAGIWDALLPNSTNPTIVPRIECPTLRLIIERAKAEWPVYDLK